MLLTPHLLAGAAIGKYFHEFWTVIPLAVLSHFILDAIPHYKMGKIIALERDSKENFRISEFLLKSMEPLFGITITAYFILVDSSWLMLIGSFFASFQDIFVFLHWRYKIPFPPVIKTFEEKHHRHTTFFKGIASQVIVSGIAVWFLVR